MSGQVSRTRAQPKTNPLEATALRKHAGKATHALGPLSRCRAPRDHAGLTGGPLAASVMGLRRCAMGPKVAEGGIQSRNVRKRSASWKKFLKKICGFRIWENREVGDEA